jgi:hypothetical protein
VEFKCASLVEQRGRFARLVELSDDVSFVRDGNELHGSLDGLSLNCQQRATIERDDLAKY